MHPPTHIYSKGVSTRHWRREDMHKVGVAEFSMVAYGLNLVTFLHFTLSTNCMPYPHLWKVDHTFAATPFWNKHTGGKNRGQFRVFQLQESLTGKGKMQGCRCSPSVHRIAESKFRTHSETLTGHLLSLPGLVSIANIYPEHVRLC